MPRRQQLLEKIQAQIEQGAAAPPVVTLDEYFIGNSDEECIAPNQLDYGRPTLAEMYARFKQIELKPNVQAVLVGIHGDWTESLEQAALWPAAENVHIYTDASLAEVEQWLAGLQADGAIEGWPYGAHPSAPAPKAGYKVYSVCWD